MKTAAVILAGGRGTRLKSPIPKQFVTVNGKPLIAYTIENVSKCSFIEGIVLVCVGEYIAHLKKIVSEYDLKKVVSIVSGGPSGVESTYFGITAVPDDYDTIVIHDGNRPLVDEDIFNNLLKVYEIQGNAVSAIPTVELTYRSSDGISSNKYLDRNKIWKTHTPQMYNRVEAINLYDQAKKSKYFSKYASTTEIYCKYGKKIYFAEGKTSNIKITFPEDIKIFEAFLSVECIKNVDHRG